MRCLFTLILVTSFFPNAAYATNNKQDTSTDADIIQLDSNNQEQIQYQDTTSNSTSSIEDELSFASSSDENLDSSEAVLASEYTEKTGEVGRSVLGSESDGVYAILIDPSTADETGDPYLLFEPVKGENGTGTLSRPDDGSTTDDYYEMFHSYTPKYKEYLKKITSIKSNGTIICSQSIASLFKDFSVLSDISDLQNWDTDNVTNLGSLFDYCEKLEDISPLTNWNISKVTNLSTTFRGCNLSNLSPIQNWSTSQVKNMNNVLSFNANITDLNCLSGWDTSNVTSMSQSFCACSGLTDISGLSSWNTAKVTNMASMFDDCGSLTSLNGLATNGDCWNTSNVTNMRQIFNRCEQLTDISAISEWDTSSVTNMSCVFNYCSSLTSFADIANWNTSSVTNMQQIFQGCSGIKNLSDLLGWQTSKVTDMSYMFSKCTGLTDASGISTWSTESATTMKNMFTECSNLQTVNLTYLNDCNAAITYPAQYVAASKSYSLTQFKLPNAVDKFLDSTATYTSNPFDVSYISSKTPADTGYCYVYEYTDDNNKTQQIKEATDSSTYAKFMELWAAGSLLSETVTIKQVPITYTVSFDANGAQGSVPSDITATYGADTSTDDGYQTYPDAPADLSNGGLEFIGWYNSADTSATPTIYKAGEAIINLTSTQGATVTLYPKWGSSATTDDKGIATIDGIQFTVSYDNDDNPDMESLLEGAKFTTVSEGSEYILVLPAAADGRNVKVVAVSAQDTTSAKQNIKISTTENSGTDRGSKSTDAQGTAEFRIKYNITYNLDNGTNPEANVSTYEYGVGLTLSDASKDNYKFDGWYTSYTLSASSKISEISNTQKGDVILYAKYSADTVTITYAPNGGTLPDGTSTTIDISNGGVITGGLPQATRPGYTLDGWYYTDNTLPTPAEKKATNLTTFSKDTVLTAKWNVNTNTRYTIYYMTQNLDGTTYSLAEKATKTDGTTDETTTVSADKTFEGFSAPAYEDIKQQKILGDGTTVVEIKYSRNSYNLTYSANGKVATNMPDPLTTSIKYGALISNQTTPSATGYIFGGWFKEQTCQNEWNFEAHTMPANIQTLYAKWTPISYKIVFNANGASGTGPEHMDLTYDTLDQKFPSQGSFTKDGYEFAGWVELDSQGAETTNTYAANATISTPLASQDGQTVQFNAIWKAIEKDSTDNRGETKITDGENVYYVDVTYDDDDDQTTSEDPLEGVIVEIVKGSTEGSATSIKVTLPDSATGRDVTVRVKDSNGVVSDMPVHAIESDNTTDRGTKDTDEKGKAIFKGRYEGTTGDDGKTTVTDPSNSNKELHFYVTYDDDDDMTNEEGPLEGAVITAYKSGEISVVLPDDATTKAVSVYVWDDDGAVIDKVMSATESTGKDRGTPDVSSTDDNKGLYVFAINNQDTTGDKGTTEITDPSTGKDLKVTVTYDTDDDPSTPEVPVKGAEVIANPDGTIDVILPDDVDDKNVTVTVEDEDGNPIAKKEVTIKDNDETRQESDKTNTDGQAKFVTTYCIKYELLGGSNSENNPKTYKKGVGVGSFENATRIGYVFDGWYTSDLSTKITNISSTSTGDVVLYANWVPVQIEQIAITFDPNGATETPDAQIIPVGSTLLSIPEVTKQGYYFDGWMNGDALVTSQTTFTKHTKIKAAFTAQDTPYSVEHYKIDADGVVDTTPISESSVGKTDSLTNAQPKEEITDMGYSVIPYSQQTINPDGTTVIKIYYTLQTCTVEFDGNGVYIDTELQTVTYGNKIERPQTPTADGKEFVGWFSDSECTSDNEWDFEQNTVNTPHIKLYAKWNNTAEPTDQPWQRLCGEDRYGTNAAIVEEGFDQTGQTVILASGENFPDALSASAFAGAANAPILLTRTNSLCDETIEQLERLAPSKVYIMGEDAAVSLDVENDVKTMLPNAKVSRIGGATRIETAIEIYKEGAQDNVWADTAIVTSSQKFADALSASPVAWANKYPIFLTDGESLTLTDEAVSSIKEGGFKKVLLLGGDTCVSDKVKDQLSGLEFERLSGETRYDTSIEIAKWAHENTGATYNTMLVAYGEKFPDALSGSALAGKRNTVMVLASESEEGLLAADKIIKSNASEIVWGSFLGGSAVISPSLARTYEDASKN